MLFLALDQSTSATKALLFEGDGRLVDRESRDHQQHYPQPGWVEHDAEEIWRHTLQVLSTLLARHPARRAEIAGLSLANQRETVVVFERATGRPLHPALVWQCRRGEALCADLVAAGYEPAVHARTGLRIDPYFSGSKLLWLARHRPDLRARLRSGEALIGTVDAYLIYRLTRGAVFATDSTNASRTLLFDLARLDWDDDLCALWETPRRALPEIRESFARFGETTLEGLLPQPVPICGVMGDSQAALLAHGCTEAGSAKVTFGTGSSVLFNLGSKLRLSSQGLVTALAWVHGGRATYAFEGIIISAASTLTWLRDQLHLFESLDQIEALATGVPDSGGVYFVPAFSGLGFPHWAPGARALLTGLTPHSDRRHLARAALEAIGYQIRDVFDGIREASSQPLESVHADGGPTRNRFLMQFTAELTQTEIRVAPLADASAFGALRAGWVGLGLSPSLRSAQSVPPVGAVYRPLLPRPHVDELHRRWAHAVRQATLTPEELPSPSPVR